jgi:NitT/TauT family transport system permease protein
MTKRFEGFFYGLAALAVFMAIWSVSTYFFDVPRYIFPKPHEVWLSFLVSWKRGLILPNLQATLFAMLTGYGIAAVVGILVGTILAEVRFLEKALYPTIVAIQSIPKIALAPFLIMWFGYGTPSKLLMVVLLCFFPILVNTMAGLKSARSEHIELMRAMKASRLQIFRHVKLPSAAGYIFSGLQVAVVMSLIGTLVSEFVGSSAGMGVMLQRGQVNLDSASMVTVLIFLVAIGLVASAVVRSFQDRVVFWEGEGRTPARLKRKKARAVTEVVVAEPGFFGQSSLPKPEK